MTNTLMTITGPSLSGKTTLENKLVERYKMEKIVSFTTRPMRQGEVSGEHYHFLSRDLAESKIANGDMAEHIEFQGNLYGILGSELQSKLQKTSCIAVVEPHGVRQLTAYCLEKGLRHKSVFLTNHPYVLAARFLKRFKEDQKASPINYCQRLVSMIRDEQAWIHEHGYDILYTSFDPGNEDFVIKDVYDKLIAIMQEPSEKTIGDMANCLLKEHNRVSREEIIAAWHVANKGKQ